MSILSDFEDRLGAALEGIFAGAFRSHVEPVELARALSRAMDDGRTVGVGRVYAPVTFTVELSGDDMRNLGDFAQVLAGELSTYLVNHAREQGYHLSARPSVRFQEEPSLRVGRFRVAADLAPAPAQDDGPQPAPARRRTTEVAQPLATVTVEGSHHAITLSGERVVVGRLADCDIRLEDANVSRQHAAFVRRPDGWHIQDLGSTNGTKVNGRQVQDARLEDGDVITLGLSRMVFHESGART
ncbi:MAG: DUF3662 and FHA domain-containing protein [Coriobacteriia bacterium]